MPWKIHKKRHLTSFQVIILGFAGVILFGALILMLPISSVQGIITPFHKALFTSTSAVCVTGLAVLDTGSYWSVFGQTVIMFLIQIGGLGVITTATAVFILSGRKISIMQRSTMQNAISAPKVGGIGLINKLKAYVLQEQGMDTVEANLALGFKDDERDYSAGAMILQDLGIKKLRLMTNNPTKIDGLNEYGLEIVERVPIQMPINPFDKYYMQTKQKKMGHMTTYEV